jgi:hypothetical protein
MISDLEPGLYEGRSWHLEGTAGDEVRAQATVGADDKIRMRWNDASGSCVGYLSSTDGGINFDGTYGIVGGDVLGSCAFEAFARSERFVLVGSYKSQQGATGRWIVDVERDDDAAPM